MTLEAKVQEAIQVLKNIEKDFSPAVFANSLGAEDMVITDLIAISGVAIQVFTLDTGRLNPETYTLLEETQNKYPALKLKIYFPESADAEQYVLTQGINGFYNSIENRKGCCGFRKIKPLRRALSGQTAWITGLRREQSVTRTEMTLQEKDEGFGLWKFNPLIEWSEAEVWEYIKSNNVPYNKLHDQNYPSIGCAPCTRAITIGEDVRAGRWWWENPETKECGLHVKQN